jgi:hypothetical protein
MTATHLVIEVNIRLLGFSIWAISEEFICLVIVMKKRILNFEGEK